MRLVFILTAVMIVILASAPAFGQQAEIGVDAGWANFPGDVSDANGWRLDFRAGFYIKDWVLLEGQMIGSHASQDVGSVDLDSTLLSGLANGLFGFRKGRWSPYALLGIGVANLQISPGISSYSDFALAWQYGGGARFFVGEKMALRAEVTQLREKTFDAWNGHWSVTGGFLWTFGER